MKISATLIVKNESSHLAECLESIIGLDEIVIVDTGSEDNTIEIAKQYTDKVFSGSEYMWRDDFAFHRNQSIDKCTGDWIFIIDADETLEPGGVAKIRKAVSSTKKQCIYIKTKARRANSYNMSIRLFRNNAGIHYKGKAHNYLSVADGDTKDITITYGYSDAHKKDPDRTLRILTKAVKEEPTPRYMYYLAREWWYRKDYEKALETYDRYLKIGEWLPEITDARLMRARCLWQLQRGSEARKECLTAIRDNPDFQEALYFMAEIHHEPWKSKWNFIADNATNKDVLFVNKKQNKLITLNK
jgi:glycosyltransferase involved in cell wall biosynthesis